ncbi:unnamed protein product [Polarella glacialis]|uniref:Uncharacterized protein n=1 Tax=Polarella glacialis TaxID=89957 RepID=A0A813IF92_POLGL|nr:unnamed protein product [Polarella glacialis]
MPKSRDSNHRAQQTTKQKNKSYQTVIWNTLRLDKTTVSQWLLDRVAAGEELQLEAHRVLPTEIPSEPPAAVVHAAKDSNHNNNNNNNSSNNNSNNSQASTAKPSGAQPSHHSRPFRQPRPLHAVITAPPEPPPEPQPQPQMKGAWQMPQAQPQVQQQPQQPQTPQMQQQPWQMGEDPASRGPPAPNAGGESQQPSKRQHSQTRVQAEDLWELCVKEDGLKFRPEVEFDNYNNNNHSNNNNHNNNNSNELQKRSLWKACMREETRVLKFRRRWLGMAVAAATRTTAATMTTTAVNQVPLRKRNRVTIRPC